MRWLLVSALLATTHCFADNMILREYWEYDLFLEEYPVQRQLTQDMQSRIYQAPVPLNIEQKRPVKIDIVYPGSQLSDYWWRNIRAIEIRLQELGIEFELNKYSSRPNLDYRQESESLQQAISNDSDYLIFTLDTSRHRKFAESVLSKNQTKLILLNITTPIKAWERKQPLMYVGFDHVRGTELLAKEYKKAFPDSADYGLVYFSPGYISEARGDTFIKFLKDSGDYSLKRAYFTKANRETGYQATLSMLKQEPNLDFIYASSTDLAFGVTDALSDLGREDIAVNGWGGGSEIAAIQAGLLDFTVVRMNDDTGLAIAEAIKLDLQNEPVPQVYSGKFEVLTKYDDVKRADALKLKAFRYSDRKE
ncbi:substrate-binding domain-containing protein [Vibrio comitans]|uniref:Autoinducer 2-binding periplasmic protein LuxP n=1 Tax=Vibrio comitans NBRC 102076 TaxID=1219078 RepID=A0A4Y3IRP3_9VIBR|nr:substrate-binding domain-containing protein [Vibrio comitans]GEA61554.1 autoinducer 2-binding periplasmic protein LuxP [Vibrio comitans NBRC 102076]